MLVIGLVGLAGAVGSVGLASVVARSAPRQRALWLGLGAGICYSASSLATREIGLLLRDGAVTDILTSPAPYELVFFSIIAISLLQRALQTGSAVVAYPVMSVTANFVPVVVGLTVLGESLPGRLAGRAVLGRAGAPWRGDRPARQPAQRGHRRGGPGGDIRRVGDISAGGGRSPGRLTRRFAPSEPDQAGFCASTTAGPASAGAGGGTVAASGSVAAARSVVVPSWVSAPAPEL